MIQHKKYFIHQSKDTFSQFEECHMKVLDSPEYMEIMADLEKISMEERMAKAFERYVRN